MMRAGEIRAWLREIPDHASIAIADDAMRLIVVGGSNWLEIGAEPIPRRRLCHAIGARGSELLCRPGHRALASATSNAENVTCEKCRRLLAKAGAMMLRAVPA